MKTGCRQAGDSGDGDQIQVAGSQVTGELVHGREQSRDGKL